MIIAILGRLPALGLAECERVFGGKNVRRFSDNTALIEGDDFNVERFGSIVKAGRVVAEIPRSAWPEVSKKVVQAYTEAWSGHEHKITLGISVYGFDRLSPRDVQKAGIILKGKLKKSPGSLRLIPQDDLALSSATSHHNKLGLSDNKVELLIVRDAKSGTVIVAESLGAQNITALARRDQGRPKRDAFVGMLPPKLALTMVNLAAGQLKLPEDGRWKMEDSPNKSGGVAFEGATTSAQTRDLAEGVSGRDEDCLSEASSAVSPDKTEDKTRRAEAVVTNSQSDSSATAPRILDPFCGTGVILQEAALLGYNVYGTDLSDKMIDYSQQNLAWLAETHHTSTNATIHQGDAMKTSWRPPIDAVACESYLGQPFSAPPSPAKLREVRGNCNHIISEFLKNIHGQLTSGTPLCVAIPAWRDVRGNFTHLPLTANLKKLGYDRIEFKNVTDDELLYYREDQVVARELLVLTSI